MAQLTLYGRPVETVFNLLGSRENDLTFSLGWALANCDTLALAVLKDVHPGGDVGEVQAVRLQEIVVGAGFTDIEIESERAAIVLEAKRGWEIPTDEQLQKYLPHLLQADIGRFLVVAEASPDFARPKLSLTIGNTEVVYRSWKQIAMLAERCAPEVGHTERRLLRELISYLKGLMTMQNVTSNLVYVVPIGTTVQSWCAPLTPAQIVLDHDIYFHPVGNRYPKEPENYLGFRWGGKLQMIRHVESYTVGYDPKELIPQMTTPAYEDRNFFYRLGPPIVPPHDVKLGKVWPSGRVHAAIDLLLTSETIAEARDRTNARLAAAGV